MKVVLKSPALDLEVDDVKKLDDVLDFVEKFLKLQRDYRKAKKKLDVDKGGNKRPPKGT